MTLITSLLIMTTAWSAPSPLPPGSQKISIERIFQSPELDGSVPQRLKFSPSGKRLTFLQPKKEDYEILDLWEFNLKTGQSHILVDSKTLQFGALSEEEKARRERMRISRRGIVEYFWSEDGERIVFPAGNDLYLHAVGQKLRRLTNNDGAEMDVKFSPKDRFVSFVRQQNLHILDLELGKEYAVTKEGKGDISYATAEFIAQEEMDRFEGYWWSDDEQFIVLTEVNEAQVKWVERYEIAASSVTTRKQRYPETGTTNAKVRLGWVRVSDVVSGNAKIEWIDLGKNDDFYLPRVAWTKDGKLAYQVQSRDQKTLDLFLYDLELRKSVKIVSEKDKHWVSLQKDWKWLESSPNLVMGSEKSGFNHLYLMDRKGQQLRALTQGIWNVDALEGVDEAGGWVYFSAWIKTPLERHLYRVPLHETGEPQQLTEEGTWNRLQMDRYAKFFVRYFSTPKTPPQVTVHQAGGGHQIAAVSSNEVNANHPLYPYRETLVTPEFNSFRGPSGERLYYSLYKPKNFDPTKKYPLVVWGYGGPGVQVVTKSWMGKLGLFANVLVEQGFLVASIDNRGSSRRGRKFGTAIHQAFGTVEVEDQKAGVEHLIKQGLVDAKRVGFFGWSYGGYLALMLATKAPGTYQATAAVAPVTDFAFYDTHYTERYLGKPLINPKVYEQANTLNFVAKMKGRLLLIHGMADDNVLFTNSTMLFKKLQDEGKIYESVTYPGAKHGLYGKSNQTHCYKTIEDFFKRTLF